MWPPGLAEGLMRPEGKTKIVKENIKPWQSYP